MVRSDKSLTHSKLNFTIGIISNFLASKYHLDSVPINSEVELLQLIEPIDSRSLIFEEAKKKEISRVLARKTWLAVSRKDVSSIENILTGRILLATKAERPKMKYG